MVPHGDGFIRAPFAFGAGASFRDQVPRVGVIIVVVEGDLLAQIQAGLDPKDCDGDVEVEGFAEIKNWSDFLLSFAKLN